MIPLFPLGSEGDISIPIPSLDSHAFHLQTPRLLLFPIISEALSFKRAHSTIQSCAACRGVCFDALPVVGFISLTLLVTWRPQERGGRGHQEEGLEMNAMHIRAIIRLLPVLVPVVRRRPAAQYEATTSCIEHGHRYPARSLLLGVLATRFLLPINLLGHYSTGTGNRSFSFGTGIRYPLQRKLTMNRKVKKKMESRFRVQYRGS